ncbi:hypothetical protein AVEN_18264-1 [Araneus ventricosus]|uniref:Uncharacterized protein n=1 Tax=Araneus ventricosus TaxID=182803 RepID=A0A4Y2AIT2_ARAVE|nr:hypothetical protein AVEN_18264-1 [Araneus ventricosus]
MATLYFGLDWIQIAILNNGQMMRTAIAVHNPWPWNILWSDKVHFTLDGAVNTQNCRVWGTASPNVVHEHSLHPDYITEFCDFTALFMAFKGVALRMPVTATFFTRKSFLSYKNESVDCLENTVFM